MKIEFLTVLTATSTKIRPILPIFDAKSIYFIFEIKIIHLNYLNFSLTFSL